MTLTPGTRLGPYEIVAAVGAGGMGEVYKANDTRLDRTVAIKKSAERFSERFEREARAVAALNHPHICTLYDVGEDYLVMEFIEGQPLSGPLPMADALRYAIQVAAALDAAHRKGIVHRDLKPDNILLAKSGVKVLDFGLAKITREGPLAGHSATMTRALTDAGSIVGTLQYMSPEQLEGKEADARSDIFAFGCVLYEILTGKPAFHATSQATLIAAIIDRDPEPLTTHQPMLPPMLERVVKKCLAKDPDKRWQHIADLKSELEWVLESGSNPAMPAPVVAQRRRNARLGWTLAGIFGVLLVAGAAAFVMLRPAPEPLRQVRFEIAPPAGVAWGTTDIPMVSPDGSRVMVSGTRPDGTHALWTRSLDAVSAVLIPGTEGALFASWSPDGKSIAFVADGRLKRLDLGGTPRVLGPTPAWGVPAWSQAGVILFERNVGPYSLEQIPADGGESKPATTAAAGLEHSHPSFLPDGRRFLYWSSGQGDSTGLYLGSLDSKETKRLAAGSSGIFASPGWLLNVRDGRLVAQAFDAKTQQLSGDPRPIVDQVWSRIGGGGGQLGGFSISTNGVLVYRPSLPPLPNELTWYDRQGTRLKAEGDPGVYTNPALSPDGKRLAVGRYDATTGSRDIWMMDLSRGLSSRFTFDNADDLNPAWSPDGSRLAFTSNRKGPRDIYWKAADGASAEQPVLETPEAKSVEDWSPDGKLVLYNVDTQEILAVPVSGAPAPSSILRAPFSQVQGHLSPDGHWIVYTSYESGRPEVFVQSFPISGGKWQVSRTGGSEASWRRDGKELFFMSGSKIYAVPVTATGSSFEVGTPKELFEVQLVVGENRRNRYVGTADGQRFLFVTVPDGGAPAPHTAVLNWQTVLKP